MKKEVIGKHTLYCGDCLDIMPSLKKVDAVITDPPYGIGCDKEFIGMVTNNKKSYGKGYISGYTETQTDWDKKPIDKRHIEAMFAISKKQIIFGGVYFDLPKTGGYLVWDKKVAMPSLSKCEFAWTSFLKHSEIFHYLWSGCRRAGEVGIRRLHPTQKPIELMRWCISLLPESDTNIILDCFMGSGTTGVACERLGRTFIGIEKEPKYFEIACRRIEAETRQEKLNLKEA